MFLIFRQHREGNSLYPWLILTETSYGLGVDLDRIFYDKCYLCNRVITMLIDAQGPNKLKL